MAYCRGRASVIAINDNYRLAPWADWLYACDYAWWKHHNAATRFHAQRWTIDVDAAREFKLELIGNAQRRGLSRDPALIHTGSNSGFQAINLAYHFGATKIVLIGYDMQETGGKQHWFGSHPSSFAGASNYEFFREQFLPLAEDLRAEGVEVINATLCTALSCFERARLEDVL